MIETLNGLFETVNYKEDTSLKLYYNDEAESYPAHWHTTLEIIMPIKNIYTVEAAGITSILREGDIIFISPGCIHTLTAPDVGERIIFQPAMDNLRFMRELEAALNMISPIHIITPEKYPDIHQKIHDILLSISDEYLQNNSFSEFLIYAKLLEILTLIGRNRIDFSEEQPGIDRAKQAEYMEKFFEICDYINIHCSEDLNLDEIADLSGFSKYHFSRLFKQFTNVSFYKYVNQKRIAKAELMLLNPQNSVTDVAISCGFSSPSSFIRMFKIIKGCTPSEFKSLYKDRRAIHG